MDKNLPNIDDYVIKRNYSNLNSRENEENMLKLSNFLKILYIFPFIIKSEHIFLLKQREKRLSKWQYSGYAINLLFYSTYYAYYRRFKIFNPKHLFFANYFRITISLLITSILTSRVLEKYANVRYYKPIIMDLALDYNFSEDEIAKLENEYLKNILKSEKENLYKKPLDTIKFKF